MEVDDGAERGGWMVKRLQTLNWAVGVVGSSVV